MSWWKSENFVWGKKLEPYDLCADYELVGRPVNFVLNITEKRLGEFIEGVREGNIELGKEALVFPSITEVVKFLNKSGFPRTLTEEGWRYLFYCHFDPSFIVKTDEEERILQALEELLGIKIVPENIGTMFLKPVYEERNVQGGDCRFKERYGLSLR